MIPIFADVDFDGTGRLRRVVDLPATCGDDLQRLPWVLRILLENACRCLKATEAEAARAAIISWLDTGSSAAAIEFHPSRILMHDTTCGPALVDIAALRSAVAEAGGNPAAISPRLPVDVSTDHSVAVDHFGTQASLALNMQREIARNSERYSLMKWASAALANVRIHPPGTGIMHTLNLEQLASVVTSEIRDGVLWAIPDTLIGTDSHTPMINGLGVLGWGVGGLEAEGVMFGLPLSLRIPDVIGVRLDGRLAPGVTATDLALTVTERLRAADLAGTFVEFFGPGVSTLTVGDRAVAANMAPEYGATTGFFPIDDAVGRYLTATGRSADQVSTVERYARRVGLWFDPNVTPRYTRVVEIDLAAVVTSLAGPRRPQDRIAASETRKAMALVTSARLPLAIDSPIPRWPVAIAAITSCTNTSDPRLLITAGLLAAKARRFGLSPPPWVKTSLAPGSPAAGNYLKRAGLLADLSALGFDIVGFGCTTCIGNSGPLTDAMQAVAGQGRQAVAVLSGNRNFPGRVHPDIEEAFLASPPMVVAFALAGDVGRDITSEPLGHATDGRAIFLHDIWPNADEIDQALICAADPDEYGRAFATASASADWQRLPAAAGAVFPWDPNSTYIRRPPFAAPAPMPSQSQIVAAPLMVLGDDITTDHISPAGQIPRNSEAADHLVANGADIQDLNVFAARRGNWQVMVRGLFTNRAVRNLLQPDLPPGSTVHDPSGEILPLWQAARRYRDEGTPLVLLAGERYGMGSSRDWAAKGLTLLGVRAVLASSFERIHRSNLIGMGIMPIRLPPGEHAMALGIRVGDRIIIDGDMSRLTPRCAMPVSIRRQAGVSKALACQMAVETQSEIELLCAGGMLPLILSRHGARAT